MSSHDFRQVDVFSAEPLRGNPVAVVHGADDLTEAQMAAFARWTNLSETTFLLTPTDDRADYRLRIFTPSGELPFAGHPTLGSAHAWVEAGGVPARAGGLVQECAAGLVQLAQHEGRLAFAAPPLRRSGPADDTVHGQVAECLGLRLEEVAAVEWLDNGPGWVGALVRGAAVVLDLVPDLVLMKEYGLKIGVVGEYSVGEDLAGAPDGCAIEVRAFAPDLAVGEDPVTGSLNAGIAQWLIGNGTLPPSYVASQGTVLGRAGRVQVRHVDGEYWIGGDTATTIHGSLQLGSGQLGQHE